MPRQDDLQIRAQRDAIRRTEYIFLLVMSVGISTDEIKPTITFGTFPDAVARVTMASVTIPNAAVVKTALARARGLRRV
jgi:hypothetical protein